MLPVEVLRLAIPPGRKGQKHTSAVVEFEYVTSRSDHFNLRKNEVEIVTALCLWSVGPFPV